MGSAVLRRLLRGIAICLPPVLVGLYVGATTFSGGTAVPWKPIMVDLDVYRHAGSVLLAGRNFYDLPGELQFIYPPFAALLAVPLALLPLSVVQIGWTTAGVLALVAVLHRYGLSGWVLSVVSMVAIYFVQPVLQTLVFGQLGIFLVALVVLDLAPGPRVLPRRLLPDGVLTGVAAAIKLTPAIFVLYLLATGKRRAFVVSVLTGVAVTVLSWAMVPRASLEFWTRLAGGDTGLGGSIIYYTNQSVMADVVRVFGLGSRPVIVGLALSAIVALAGVWAATLWHRLGEVRFARGAVRRGRAAGLAGVLAAPLRLGGAAGGLPGRAATARASLPGLVPGPRLGVRGLGGGSAVPSAAERGRHRAALDLVAASAGLGDGDSRGCVGHRGNRRRTATPASSTCAGVRAGSGRLDGGTGRCESPPR